MSYLKKLGLHRSGYDKAPFIEIKDHPCWTGWEAVCARLKDAIAQVAKPRVVVAVECYSGVLDEELIPALSAGLGATQFTETLKIVFKEAETVDALVAPWLGGDDPIFGFMTALGLADFLEAAKIAALKTRLAAAPDGVHVVYGPGALLACDPDLVVYADMARWEAQMRQRRDQISNLGVENRTLKAALQYKRSYFVDWRVCDKHKAATFDRWDFLLDTCEAGHPKLVTGETFRAAMDEAVRRPFRVVPFFDPGPWGGQWMREICDLPDGPPNYAWCFDCVPEENSLLLGFGDTRVEIPSINVVLRHPRALLGQPVYGLFGAWFPIRFDLLDTMDGGPLSFQVHPLIDYARHHFGIPFTQDESYYLLDAEEEARVYLGLKDGIDGEAMIADLQAAQEDPDRLFDDEKYVASWPAKRHDHFLIPAGTCHCSGKDSLVLEISHTPYIFTFKLWDWNRLGLDGKPRPINIHRARDVIVWGRTASWVKDNLVNRFTPLGEGEGWREERTGLYQSQYIETHRHWFTGPVAHDTRGESVHVLNLVQGAEAVVKSPTQAFEPFVIHYAETFIVPAAIGRYTIEPHGENAGQECATLKAFIRTNRDGF